MKAFVIGGTGLLGYNSTLELLKDGHEVSSIGLTPPPQGGIFKKLVKYSQVDVAQATDRELLEKMKGSDWLLYAFSASSHTIAKWPAIDYYTNVNIYTTERILRLAQDANIKKVVLLSNYYEYFNIEWSHMGLARYNPYIKATFQQEISARAFNKTNFQVVVLQLPVVFGIMPKRKPYDYKNILEQYNSKNFNYFGGGTAVMTVKQVAQCVLGAFKYGQGGRSYAVAGDNLKYEEINRLTMTALGVKGKCSRLSRFKFKWVERRKLRKLKKQKLEPGLNNVKMLNFYEKNAYISPSVAKNELKMQDDDVKKQIVITALRVKEIATENGEIRN